MANINNKNSLKNNISSKVYKAMPSSNTNDIKSTPAPTGINSTEKIKPIKPAIRIQELKNQLIILAHDLKINKKINDSLYRKIQLLTYSRTTEQKLNESLNTLKKLNKVVKKAEELQGPIKPKKLTLTDFKKETPKKKQVFNNNNNNNNTVLIPYDRIITDKLDNVYYKFYTYLTDNYLEIVSTDYLNFKKYKLGSNKDYIPIEKKEHARKKPLFILLMGM